jgi:DivIVA domain-containing protein
VGATIFDVSEQSDQQRPRRRTRAFRLARFTSLGYERQAVDTFLRQAERSLSSTPPTMAPYQIQDARFPAVRWSRGYDLREVDERMDQLRDELRELHGDDGVSEVQGHASERRHRRIALGIYIVAGLIVAALLVIAVLQL